MSRQTGGLRLTETPESFQAIASHTRLARRPLRLSGGRPLGKRLRQQRHVRWIRQTAECYFAIDPLHLLDLSVGDSRLFKRRHLEPHDRLAEPPPLPLKPIFGRGEVRLDSTAPSGFFQHLTQRSLRRRFPGVEPALENDQTGRPLISDTRISNTSCCRNTTPPADRTNPASGITRSSPAALDIPSDLLPSSPGGAILETRPTGDLERDRARSISAWL